MPIEQVWALVMVLVGVTILVIIDDFRRSLALKSVNEELTMLRKQLEMEMRKNEESISTLKEIHFKEISHLEEFKKNMTDDSYKSKKNTSENIPPHGWMSL